MAGMAALPPIPGDPIDPPPKNAPGVVKKLEERGDTTGATVGIAFRALTRFSGSRASLLAAGTTYYAFLALFSLIALAYGVVAILGADDLALLLTEAISEAFPGLLGDEGIDPDQLRAVGQAAGIVGLLTMLYAGGGAMGAVSASIHLVYGAPPDPRSLVPAKLRLLGWLLVLGPLLVLSFVGGSVLLRLGGRLLAEVGVAGTTGQVLLSVLGIAVTLAIDGLVVYLLLTRFGGIRPPRRAVLPATLVGAVILQIVRLPLAFVLELSLDNPRYGAFAIPIGVLLVIYLNTLAIYGAAALAAGLADRDVPLEELVPIADEDEPNA